MKNYLLMILLLMFSSLLCLEIISENSSSEFDLDELERHVPGVSAKTRIINAPLLEIASSEIRQRIREGRPYRYYLLPQVKQIIKARGLYLKPDPDL